MPGLLLVPSPYFIVGPTAVGKTEIAVRAAELAGAEIINADAFQVYEGLDRLTAKPTASDLARVPHHLIGHVYRAETYNVARYHEEATVRLDDATQRGRPAIVVGGSGLYVKSLTHGLSPLPPARPELRAELDGMDTSALYMRVEELDPPTARTIDRYNKRRLIRAVEVCLLTGRRFSDQQITWKGNRPPVHGVFLTRDKQELHHRIERRAGASMADESLQEVTQALELPLSDTASRIIGLAEIRQFLAGAITRSACLENIRSATRRYAKRQMTWFRGESFETSIDLTTGMDAEACATFIARKILDAPVRADVR